ncbi:MAG: hypothetical protein SGI96_12790 [Bacteroidota bacterium]|nr:hypothetical protein [Bacteroidota bacterium]
MVQFLIGIAINASSQTYNFYRGNLHAHTAYSDGNKDSTKSHVNTPAGSFQYAKQSANFDYIGISEHNHYTARENPGMHLEDYAKGVDQAKDENEDGSFVCLYGMEFGIIMGGGHVLIYGVDSLIGWESGNYDIYCGKSDYKNLWKILTARPASFAILAHPEDVHFKRLLQSPYNATADQAICGVAVVTGPFKSKMTNYKQKPSGNFYSYYKWMLAKGYHLGPVIDHDTHMTVFGRSHPSRTVVLAESLDREHIMDAYRSMRFYSSGDRNVEVCFTINGEVMGSPIEDTDNIVIDISILDEDIKDKTVSIKILSGKPGSNVLPTVFKSIPNSETFSFRGPAPSSAYYFLEITQKDGDKIYTAPIWVRK